jgi:hypothetical protein
MESPEKLRQVETITHILWVLGVLFFIASGLAVMPKKYAVFAGIACFLIAPVVRRLGQERQ